MADPIIQLTNNLRLRLRAGPGSFVFVDQQYRWDSEPGGWKTDPEAGICVKRKAIPEIVSALQLFMATDSPGTPGGGKVEP
jgi:hypothetical protein